MRQLNIPLQNRNVLLEELDCLIVELSVYIARVEQKVVIQWKNVQAHLKLGGFNQGKEIVVDIPDGVSEISRDGPNCYILFSYVVNSPYEHIVEGEVRESVINGFLQVSPNNAHLSVKWRIVREKGNRHFASLWSNKQLTKEDPQLTKPFLRLNCPAGLVKSGQEIVIHCEYGNSGLAPIGSAEINQTLTIPEGVSLTVLNTGTSKVSPAVGTKVTGPCSAQLTYEAISLTADHTDKHSICCRIDSAPTEPVELKCSAWITENGNKSLVTNIVADVIRVFSEYHCLDIRAVCPSNDITVGSNIMFSIIVGNKGNVREENIEVRSIIRPTLGATLRLVSDDGVIDTYEPRTEISSKRMGIFNFLIPELAVGTEHSLHIIVNLATAPAGINMIENLATIVTDTDEAETAAFHQCRVQFMINSSVQEGAICEVLNAVAKEEFGIAHILNAEADKIRKALSLTEDINDIIAVDNSVQETIKRLTKYQILLEYKIEDALRLHK